MNSSRLKIVNRVDEIKFRYKRRSFVTKFYGEGDRLRVEIDEKDDVIGTSLGHSTSYDIEAPMVKLRHPALCKIVADRYIADVEKGGSEFFSRKVIR